MRPRNVAQRYAPPRRARAGGPSWVVPSFDLVDLRLELIVYYYGCDDFVLPARPNL